MPSPRSEALGCLIGVGAAAEFDATGRAHGATVLARNSIDEIGRLRTLAHRPETVTRMGRRTSSAHDFVSYEFIEVGEHIVDIRTTGRLRIHRIEDDAA
jgi:hypothetical protein